MAKQRTRSLLPVPVVLDEHVQRAHQLIAILALPLFDRLEHAPTVRPQRLVVLQRQQQLECPQICIRSHLRGAAIAQPHRLQRAASLVEGHPQRVRRHRARRRRPYLAEATRKLRANLARQLHRRPRSTREVRAALVDHSAQQPRANRNQTGDFLTLQHRFHHRRRRARVLGLERQYRHLLADPERSQSRLQVLRIQVPRQQLRQLIPHRRPLQQLIALIQPPRKRPLGDRYERQLVWHLKQRERTLLGRRHQRRRPPFVSEARAKAQPRDLVVGQAVDQLALGLRAAQLDARRQQQLAAFQPRRRVLQLGAVNPT